jgi:hypothetical protein
MQKTLTSLLLLLTAISATAQSPPGPRFSGNAMLETAAPASADGRFSISAELQLAAATKIDGRFRLDAHLKPQGGAKVIATACGAEGVNLFSNGFEN